MPKLNQLFQRKVALLGIVLVVLILVASFVFYQTSNQKSDYIPGEIVVGFKKGVTQEEAEELIASYDLEFTRTKDVNMGKDFFYKVGESFIIKVPKGKEEEWAEEFLLNSLVEKARRHIDPEKTLLD